MKFFIDTANLDEIRAAYAWGIISGVTTNPSLIAREGGDFIQQVHQICEIVDGPVSAEVVAQDPEGMLAEGRKLATVHENIVVKVPLTLSGLSAVSVLSAEGIRTNVTLCFSAGQALLAARAGATYVSPFVGRVDDIGEDGIELIEQIVQIYDMYPEIETQVLSASVRHVKHLIDSALAGAHVATVPFNVLEKTCQHPLTAKGNAAFLADWAKVPDTDIVGQVNRWHERNA
jgi:transaldolase